MPSNSFKLRIGKNSIILSLHDTLYSRFQMFELELKVKWLFYKLVKHNRYVNHLNSKIEEDWKFPAKNPLTYDSML